MLVSVIIPVFNAADTLPTALDALRAQSFTNWEALCVDDGSTDASLACLEAYAARDTRIRVFRQPNCGVSAARNRALDAAGGDVILFLDPDDTIASDWIERMTAPLVDADWVLSGFSQDGTSVPPPDAGARYQGDDARRRVWRAFFGYRLRDLAKALLPGGLWARSGREMSGVWRCALRRSVFGDVRFDTSLRLYEDMIYLTELARQPCTLSVIGDAGYRWHIHPQGAMTRERREHLLENKFAVRDARLRLDPGLRHHRGTRILSALEILRETASLRHAVRYLLNRPLAAGT